VLIFDEGTSALDNATEALLMDASERLRGQRTIILVFSPTGSPQRAAATASCFSSTAR
jgi:ABC-type transport system involved in cytochrome bd biosynthesis fused ATPase/permease subunit